MKSKFRLRILVLCAVFAALLCFAPGIVWAGEFCGLGYTAPAGYTWVNEVHEGGISLIGWGFEHPELADLWRYSA